MNIAIRVDASTWERCCLGLPSLVVSIAENQRPACEALAAAGVIAYLGHHSDLDREHLRTSLQRLTQTATIREGLAQASAALVDGLGVERVTQAMNTLERPIP